MNFSLTVPTNQAVVIYGGRFVTWDPDVYWRIRQFGRQHLFRMDSSLPDPILGERACAFVLLKEGASLRFEEAVDFLKTQHLAVWQLPERLEIVDDFPRGPGGKILKSALTKLVTEKLKAEGKIPS